ncbi:hypothetical protein SDRG_11405 [Saprolegnia diclina VS20]|uniref:Uncharacterized protein n=1 Tax=Saprolegnia diclina (strain VS20) TaxID=1156394 RepID=T0Q8I5_SAPDV|nr:hypothetical protein SDRG_11405 [Saprolegnia diclina VS20]EQC30926.1 hypothetical protein SDRG_11405 [Saprolegnia diclina VS20]|eukprot:XP_008615664.1 hypothetical protein SDRG_11405 [Saprolegnia diclina VS20]
MLRPLTFAALLALVTAQLQEKKLCTATGLIVSEYYGRIFTDLFRHSNNERFLYNATAKSLMTKSNGQCLEAQPLPPHPYFAYGLLKTAPCDISKQMQQWTIENDRVFIAESTSLPAYCLEAHSIFQPGSDAGVAPCDFGKVTTTTMVDCATVKTTFVAIKTLKSGNRLSEYYSNLYVNAPANNFNELFTWDQANKMLKVASNNQCLDAYKDSADGKFKLHTTKTLEHATHAGQCLDADPTYADRHAQMWACTPNNVNQQWSIDTFFG